MSYETFGYDARHAAGVPRGPEAKRKQLRSTIKHNTHNQTNQPTYYMCMYICMCVYTYIYI